MVKDIKIEDFDYNLPEERIALHPSEKRDGCRLLLSRPDGKLSHRKFKELAGLLPVGSLMVCNDTKVINARLEFYKDTGARIEIFLLEPLEPSDYVLMFQSNGKCVWRCLVGNLKKWKEGSLSLELRVKDSDCDVKLKARRLPDYDLHEGEAIEFSWEPSSITFASLIEAAGQIPIPPYLNRNSEESDIVDYQTIYARTRGSVAAPTAGLHFTPEIFADLASHNIETAKLTLHVGAGTFQPVKSEKIGDHPMHTETFSLSLELLNRLIRHKEERKPLAAVGTTTVRTLESLPILGSKILRGDTSMHVSQWEAYDLSGKDSTIEMLKGLKNYMISHEMESLTASTAIMIAPGFKWRMTDVMVTNFHQPQSTLLLLVSSFLEKNRNGELTENEDDKEMWRTIYEEALKENYRFLSYGDACLFVR